jgi:DNA mismatch endonuclease (patch repair protein)
MFVRSLLHRLGYRFRLHRADLPGRPDIVLPSRHKIILVHGCFWHMHRCKFGRVVPKTNEEFWKEKRLRNRDRDKITLRQLRQSGWDVLVLWECWLKHSPEDEIRHSLLAFIDPGLLGS